MRKTLLLSVLALALTGGQASAHARLLRAAPRVGATVTQSPAELRLWFSETIEAAHSSVTLSAINGPRVPLGRLALDPKDPRVVVVPIQGSLAPGRYHVEWRMTSADTHHMDGDYFFGLKP